MGEGRIEGAFLRGKEIRALLEREKVNGEKRRKWNRPEKF